MNRNTLLAAIGLTAVALVAAYWVWPCGEKKQLVQTRVGQTKPDTFSNLNVSVNGQPHNANASIEIKPNGVVRD
jgi:hypothetical protein